MAFSHPQGEDPRIPFGNFAFHVNFETLASNAPSRTATAIFKDPLWGGFSEISGLEASMEHKVIKEGGRNYGTLMRAGQTTFGTVILKRGIISSRHLWAWWSFFAGADLSHDAVPTKYNRCNLLIGLTRRTLKSPEERKKPETDKSGTKTRQYTDHHVAWRLRNVMPVKFKVGDFNAKGTDVAVEELHVVHEGLDMEMAPAGRGGR
jgi:phage tail-like protein